MKQMCYNCKRETIVIYWSGTRVCANCAGEYEETVSNVQTGETNGGVRSLDVERTEAYTE